MSKGFSEKMKNKKISLLLTAIFLSFSSLFSMENLSVSLRTGKVLDGVIKDNYLFIASERGVDIYDIANPNNPVIAYYLDTPGICSDVSIKGNILFTADGPSGVEIYDISNPVNPIFLTSFGSQKTLREIFTRDSIFSTSTEPSGISIFKYSASGNITELSNIQLNYEVNGLFIRDSLLLAGLSNNRGFVIYDIANPANPQQLSPNYSNLLANDIAGNDTVLFLASGNDGVRIFNIKDPTSPDSICAYALNDYILHTSLFDSLLFLCGLTDTVFVLNIINPSNPIFLGKIHTLGPAAHILTYGSVVYIPEINTGELFALNGFTKLATLDSLYPVTDGFVNDTLAYVSREGNGLTVLNTSNPHHPFIVSTFDSLKNIEAIYVNDTIAYLSCGDDGLFIVDVALPTNIHTISSLNTPGTLKKTFKRGNVLFLADGSDGFEAVSIENIKYPVMLDSLHLPGYVYDICLQDTIAYLSIGIKGIAIVNIKDPQNLALIDTMSACGFSKSLVSNQAFLYIGTEDNKLKVYDISSPAAPQLISTLSVDGPVSDVKYVNNLIFLSCNENGLNIVNVSNPYLPFIKDSLNTSGIAFTVHPGFGAIPVADYYSFRLDSFPMSDTVPPSPVSNLSMEPQDSLIILRWTNPQDADYKGTRLLFRNDTFPQNENDGMLLLDHEMEPNSPDSFYHTQLPGDSTHFYYAVYAYDYADNFSTPSFVSGISATDTIPPDEVLIDSLDFWADTIEIFFMTPSNADFNGVRALFDTTHIPLNIYDGNVFFDTTLTYNSYISRKLGGVTPNKTYYFTFFTKDSIPNFSNGAGDSVKTYDDTIPPDTIREFSATQIIPDTIRLNWINPPDPDFEKVTLRYSTEFYPQFPPSSDSGRILWNITAAANDTIEKFWVSSNFRPGVRYYLSAFSIDKTGNVSGGAHTNCITPALTKVDNGHPPEPYEGTTASWLDSVEVSFTSPVQITTLYSGVSIVGRKQYSFSILRESGNRYILLPAAFSALDTITVTLKGIIKDTLGNPFDGNGNGIPDSVDEYSWYFNTNIIGDYTMDNAITSEDFAVFREAYYSHDVTKETGPVSGTIPYYTLQPDSTIDFEDFSVFIMMWNWSLDNRGIPEISNVDTDSLLRIEAHGNNLVIYAKNKTDLIGGDIILDGIDDSVSIVKGNGLKQTDVFLARIKTGKVLLSFGVMSKQMENDEIASLLLPEEKQKISYAYRFLFKNRIVSGKGSFSFDNLVPDKAVLKLIQPNPGKRIGITYGIHEKTNVEIYLYDACGRKIQTLRNCPSSAGYHTVYWDGKKENRKFPAGVYFVVLKVNQKRFVKSLILLR